MAAHRISRTISLGALALAGAFVAYSAVARADEFSDFGGQAEWAQNYDADARLSVQRSTVPVLSQATFDATERAIEQYRTIVQNGGWRRVPSGRTLVSQ